MNKEDLLSRWKIKIEKITLSDGTELYAKELTAGEKEELDKTIVKNYETGELDLKDYRFKLLTFLLCDESGRKLFSFEEYDLLKDLPERIVNEIMDVTQKLFFVQQNLNKS